MSEERWLPVPGFDGIYEISDQGRVRRVVGGKGVRSVPYYLCPRPTRKGYTRVRLDQRDYSIHRLVLTAFVGPAPTSTHQVNHRDGDKRNNALANLEWSTPEENMRHSVAAGLRTGLAGEANGRAKLTGAMVTEIRHRKGLEAQRATAAAFGVSKSLVGQIQTGTIWRGER